MDIKQQWHDAVAEFGDRAFERYNVFNAEKGYVTAKSNKEVEQEDLFLLKPLHDLFQHDVSVYGDNAHLMWEWRRQTGFCTEGMPSLLNAILKNHDVKRKTSAALPFDLERAKAGDAVYHIAGGDISNISIHDRDDYHPTGMVDGVTITFYDIENLKMKYPPKLENQK